MQQSNSVGTMFDVLSQAMQSYTKMVGMAAIWLNKPIYINRDNQIVKASRICAGNLLSIEDGVIVDYKEHSYPHYKVVKCTGTIDNSRLEMEVQNLDTEELTTIKF